MNDPANKGNGYLDIDDAMDKLYQTICRIYCDACGKHPEEIGEKSALDMLTVSKINNLKTLLQDIEHKAMVYIEALGEFARTNHTQLMQFEDSQLDKYKYEKQKKLVEEEQAAYRLKQEHYKKASNKTFSTAGRRVMERSKKNEMTRKEKTPERDED